MSLASKILRQSSTTLRRCAPAVSQMPTQPQRDMSKKARPISPHVQIYDFPITALTSITHRATGTALTIGMSGFSMMALGGNCDIPAMMETFKTSAPILVPVAKATIGFPFVYHYIAGARHLYWDATAKGLDLESVNNSSKAVVAASAVGTLALAFYTC